MINTISKKLVKPVFEIETYAPCFEVTNGYKTQNTIIVDDNSYILATYIEKNPSSMGYFKDNNFALYMRGTDAYDDWLNQMKKINETNYDLNEYKSHNCFKMNEKITIVDFSSGFSTDLIGSFIIKKSFGSLDALLDFINENKEYIGEIDFSNVDIQSLRLGKFFMDMVYDINNKRLNSNIFYYDDKVTYDYFYEEYQEIFLNEPQALDKIISQLKFEKSLDVTLTYCQESGLKRYCINDKINDEVALLFTIFSYNEGLFSNLSNDKLELLYKQLRIQKNKIENKKRIELLKERLFKNIVKQQIKSYKDLEHYYSIIENKINNHVYKIKNRIKKIKEKIFEEKIKAKFNFFKNKTFDEIAEIYISNYEDKFLFLYNKVLEFNKLKIFESIIISYLIDKYYFDFIKYLKEKYFKFKNTKLYIDNKIEKIYFYYPETTTSFEEEYYIYPEIDNNGNKFIRAEKLLKLRNGLAFDCFINNENFVEYATLIYERKKVENLYEFDFKNERIYEEKIKG